MSGFHKNTYKSYCYILAYCLLIYGYLLVLSSALFAFIWADEWLVRRNIKQAAVDFATYLNIRSQYDYRRPQGN